MGRDDDDADPTTDPTTDRATNEPTAEVPRWSRETAPFMPRSKQAKRDQTSQPPSRWKLGEELGRGGMGTVIAASDTVLDREVAIKQALDQGFEMLELFEREAKITAKLEHPSIVPIYDAGVDEH